MKKLFIITILSICFYGNLYAQEVTDVKEVTKERKNAIGISGGTGYGFDYSRTLKQNKLYLTASYNIIAIAVNDIEQEISGENLLIDTELDFKNVDFKISYHPFSNAFKLVGGIGFFSSSSINVETEFEENIVVGEVEFNSVDSGNLIINTTWSKTSPYLGFGFGRAVPNKKWGFAVDFGSYFSSSPEITLDATGIIEQSKDQEGLLNESFESFKFIPYGSFRISYSF
jgi:hypothetical protein